MEKASGNCVLPIVLLWIENLNFKLQVRVLRNFSMYSDQPPIETREIYAYFVDSSFFQRLSPHEIHPSPW